MGLYLNPGNEAFRKIRSGVYIDKTDLIDYINQTIPTTTFLCEIVKNIQVNVIEELREVYPLCIRENEAVLANALFAISHKTGNKFVVIIDEWDALFREAKDAFGDAVSGEGWTYVATAIQDSDNLLEATMKGDCEKVAAALEKTHESVASVLEYNNKWEQ